MPGEGECDVWYAGVEELLAGDGEAQAFAVLAADERARHDRYLVDHARREYLATRLLARTLLGAVVGQEPKALSFVLGPWGKPVLTVPDAPRFNLSNTRGMVACAITARAEVGVDVERADRDVSGDSIAEHYFSRREVAALHALPPEARPERFFTLWTLKEAYIKARGMGLALPLDGFSMLVDDVPIGLAFEPSIADDPSRWHLEQRLLAPALAAAVCVERGAAPANVRWRPGGERVAQLRK